MGFRSRQFNRAIRVETNLNDARGVIVVEPDGSLTMFGSPELDRADLAQALVALAFGLADNLQLALVPGQRGAGSDEN